METNATLGRTPPIGVLSLGISVPSSGRGIGGGRAEEIVAFGALAVVYLNASNWLRYSGQAFGRGWLRR